MTFIASAATFIFGGDNILDVDHAPRWCKRITTEEQNPLTARSRAIKRLTKFYREENERLRKPCKTCGTLVRPELQQQHDDAYHSGN